MTLLLVTLLVAANISAPISAEVKLEKKVGVWVKIPCVDDVGSWCVVSR